MKPLTNATWRHDRHGKKTLVFCDETRQALAELQAALARHESSERAALKNRQDAGALTMQERMLVGIFGDIK